MDYEKMSDEEFMNLLDKVDDDDAGDESADNTGSADDIEPVESDDAKEDVSEEPEENEENTEGEENEEVQEEESDEKQDEEEVGELSEKQQKELDDATKDMSTQEKIDYEKAYKEVLAEKQKYEDFYKQVTSEFVANGKVMKGFDDPKKIIQAQQMAAGFSEKMKSFKKYRPFIKPLQEKGLLDNPDKFNLMMSAIDGDKAAIQKLIADAKIDPMEIDTENVNYTPTNHVASDLEVALDDVIETADQHGVRDRVEQVISKDWDDQSVIELLSDPESQADLIAHLDTGIYDAVQERIAQKKMTDPYGAYSSKPAIEQYREAAMELEQEYMNYLAQQQQMQQQQQQPNMYLTQNHRQQPQFTEEQIQAEMQKIMQEKQQSSSANTGSTNNVNEARKRAASVSRKKPRSKPKTNEEFDPMKLSDDEFEEYLMSFMNS